MNQIDLILSPKRRQKVNLIFNNFYFVFQFTSILITDDREYLMSAFIDRMWHAKVEAFNPSIIEGRCII